MTYYTVPEPSTNFHIVSVGAKTYHTVGNPTTSWHYVFRTCVRTWSEICKMDLLHLKSLGLDTFRKLYAAKIITIIYDVADPSTTYYEVT